MVDAFVELPERAETLPQLLARVARAVPFMAAFACSSEPQVTPPPEDHTFAIEKLKDPRTCRECHLQHYQEWSASMHAYASKDPVFLAMNRRGQEETGGKLGSFCVNCHAPMAVREGKTSDGLDLAELPDKYQGVTCYFCHNAEAVEGTHNNPIRLAKDDTMRGGFKNPVSNPAHSSEYSLLMSGSSPASADVCGSCHDIVLDTPAAVTPLGGEPVKLERTFSEWRESIFSPHADAGVIGLPCASCHMPPPSEPFERFAPAAQKSGVPVPARDLHEHLFPGIDVALTPFPVTGNSAEDALLQSRNSERIQSLLNSTVQVKEICVKGVNENASRLSITLENVGAGHAFPSGASHDRRAWVEVKAYVDGSETPVYQSGAVESGKDVTQLDDRDLWLFRDILRGTAGTGDKEPHMFWDIAESEPRLIPFPVTRDETLPTFYKNHVSRQFPLAASASIAAPADIARLRVTVLIRVQPMGFDVLDDLIASGHLDPTLRSRMPIFGLYPNYILAGKPEVLARAPELARLAQVSFEWSQAVVASGYFESGTNTQKGLCVGMKSRL